MLLKSLSICPGYDISALTEQKTPRFYCSAVAVEILLSCLVEPLPGSSYYIVAYFEVDA
jgi:hypothetical protein